MAEQSLTFAEFSLAGKNGLVIGADRPLGRIAAITLAQAGANLIIASQEADATDKLDNVARELAASGRKVVQRAQDAARRTDLAATVELAVRELGSLEIAVNACDYRWFGAAATSDDSDFDRVIEKTLKATWIACQQTGRVMLDRGGGTIVNMLSILSERGVPNAGLYCAAQAAILNLTRALALEWAAANVRVNALQFGWLESEGEQGWRDEEFRQSLLRYLPDRQLVESDDIAGALLYMVSPAAAFMTGQAIAVEGGLLCRP